jgi:quercetin dioxygenase-like cupin family protein
MKSGKVWGETSLIFKNDNFEVHRISVKQNSYCSKHKHNYKHNMFYVESGTLTVKVWKNDYELIDETKLRQGEMLDVSPGEYHQFYSGYDPVIAYEIYYSQPISNDIVRETCGGKKDV